MTKILIVPDIHNKWFEAEQIIDMENADRVVFLGDYFDSFDDNAEIAYETACWLKTSVETPNRIHLIGNHDLSYINQDYTCSGFTQNKLWAIKNAHIDFSKLRYYCLIDNWLCTHAGLTKGFFKAYAQYETQFIPEFLDYMIENYEYRLSDCTPYRGGNNAHAGILWCDYDEFEPIPNINQIFGHTHGDIRFKDDNNICIDTWLNYYAVYEDGVMTVVKNE